MKKVVLSLALVAIVSLVSCKKTETEGDAANADTTTVVTPEAETPAPATTDSAATATDSAATATPATDAAAPATTAPAH